MSLKDRLKETSLIRTGKDTGQSTQGSPQSLRSTANSAAAVARPSGRGIEALTKAAVRTSQTGMNGHIGFLIDASASRENSWQEAQGIQAKMFERFSGQYGTMTMRLVHFGDNKITDHGWEKNTRAVAEAMAKVQCITSSTMILPGLRVFLDDGPAAKSIIVVGDDFDSAGTEDIPALAEELKARGTKVFTFLDGHCYSTEVAFRMLAEQTGGVFAKFGADMPLEDLCEGVALMSAGGADALSRLQNAKARQLLLTAKL